MLWFVILMLKKTMAIGSRGAKPVGSARGGRAVTLAQIRQLPYALALAFACAWVIDPSPAVPEGFVALMPSLQYSHLLITAAAFLGLALAYRRVGVLLQKRRFVILTCILCLGGFVGAWLMRSQSGGPLFFPAFVCFCMMTLCQAILIVACLKAFTGLSMVDCILTLIAWQFFVAILRGAVPALPVGLVSCAAPVVVALCLTRRTIEELWAKSPTPGAFCSEPAPTQWDTWALPVRLVIMNALVIFTIQCIQRFSPTPVSSVSFLGLFCAIAIVIIVLAINKRIIRMRQLYIASIVVMELGIIIFSFGSVFAFEAASVVLDAAYMAFSTFFFTVLSNVCQRRGNDPVLVFSLAYFVEQLAAFSADGATTLLGSGVHTTPLVILAGLGAIVFVGLSTEEDQRAVWSIGVEKTKYIDPARYYHTLAEVCSSVTMQYSLSKRESDVLLLLAQKKTATQISADLVVSIATVKTHTYNIYKKIGLHSRQELFQFLGLESAARGE